MINLVLKVAELRRHEEEALVGQMDAKTLLAGLQQHCQGQRESIHQQ